MADTDKLGLHRPSPGSTAWGDGEIDDLNANFTLLEELLLPHGGATEQFQVRVVAKSFSGLSVPTGTTKVFGSIQDAIDDVPPTGGRTPSPILVYPGEYRETLVVRDRSIHVYGVTPVAGNTYTYDYPLIRSNYDSGTANGRACINIHLRSGEDESHPSGQNIWNLANHQHVTRDSCVILFSNLFFDNYGKYYVNAPHDQYSTYFVDCTDGGVPPYYGKQSWLSFNNCVFRGQTWHSKASDGVSIVSWYKYGFRLRAFGLTTRFTNCGAAFYTYGGGTSGKSGYPSGVFQPFFNGTDGTSFLGWYMGPPGGTYEATRYTSNPTLRPYYNNRSTLRLSMSDVHAQDYAGNFLPNPPYDVTYVGNGWLYGHGSDSSCAVITLKNMGYVVLRDCKLSPPVWGNESNYGENPSDPNIELSNWIHLAVDPGDPNVTGAVHPTIMTNGVDDNRCSSSGLSPSTALLFPGTNTLLNEYGNFLGGYQPRDLG